jgi:hypothetical protein
VAPGLDQQAACDPLNARFVQVVGSSASDNPGALHLRSDLSATPPSLGVLSTAQNLEFNQWRIAHA